MHPFNKIVCYTPLNCAEILGLGWFYFVLLLLYLFGSLFVQKLGMKKEQPELTICFVTSCIYCVKYMRIVWFSLRWEFLISTFNDNKIIIINGMFRSVNKN